MAAQNSDARALRAVLAELTDTQWYDPDRLAEYQTAALRPLLQWAKRHVPYYRERFREIPDERLASITVAELGELPLLDRATLRSNQQALVVDAIPDEHGGTATVHTSGSTGQPVEVRITSHSQHWMRGYQMRDHYWHERDLTRTLLGIRSANPGQGRTPVAGASWSNTTALLHKTGPGYFLSVACSVPDQVEHIRELGPEYLLTYPTNLEALARYCRAEGIRLDSLLQVRTLSEVLSDTIRGAVREAWDVKLTDVYSCTELGSLAIQCPAHEHYHVSAEHVVLEVIDDDGAPCGPGELGRVVVTGLRGYATPLIRYELGDFARVGEACDCGRGLPVLDKIVGRGRNRIRLPNGHRIWANAGYALLSEVPQIQQVQYVQNQVDTIDVKLVVSGPLTDDQIALLREGWTAHFSYPFNFEIHYVDEIPRSAGGKYEDMICNL